MFHKLHLAFYYFFIHPIYKLQFGQIGKGTRLIKPMIDGHKRIFLGDKVFIRKNTWLAAYPVTGIESCRLIIGDGSYLGNFCHVFASSKIEIGKKVLIADRVYISDNVHGYKNIHLPIIDQPVEQTDTVLIDDGAWIGENVCIIGASVGKNSVIGANAVVTKNIPDYCLAVGAPAKIIKRYNFEHKEWQKTNKFGEFI